MSAVTTIPMLRALQLVWIMLFIGISTDHAISADADGAGSVRRIELRLEDGKLAAGPQTLKVGQTEKIELVWSSDTSAEIHLHGYDLQLHIEAGKTAVMPVHALVAGRFPISLHHTGKKASHGHHVLMYLEVHPD